MKKLKKSHQFFRWKNSRYSFTILKVLTSPKFRGSMYRKQDETRASQHLNPWSLTLMDSKLVYIKVRLFDDRFSIIFRKSEMKWQDNYPDENRSRKPGQVASVITNRNGPLALSTRTRMIPMPAPGHSSHTLTHLLPSHIIISSTEPGVTNVKITCHHLQPGSCQCLVTSLRPGPRPGNNCLCSALRTLSPRNPGDSLVVVIASCTVVIKL